MKSGGDSDGDDPYFRAFQHTARLQPSHPTQTIETNNVTVSRLVAVPKRSVFVAACLDFVLRVYQYADTSKSNPYVLSGGHKSAVMDVIHLHDDVVASVALDGSICTWKISAPSTKKSPKSPKPPTSPSAAVQHALVDSLRLDNERATSIASLNANHIVVGTESGKLIILKHKARGEALHVAKTLSHADSVLRIAAMENDYFASVSRDKTARVWNTTNIPALQKPFAALSFDSPVVSVAMNHEHHLIALGTAMGALHVYYISDVNAVEKVFQLGDVDFCLNSIRFVSNDILAIACLSGCVAFVSISKQKVISRIVLDRSTFLMDTAPLGDGRLVAVGMRNFSAVFQVPDAILKGIIEKSAPETDDGASIRSSKKVNPVRSTSSKRGMRIKGGPVVKSGSSKKGIRLRNSTGGTAAAAAATAGGDEANETLVLRKGASNSSLSAMADEARRSAGITSASNNSLSAMADAARRANNNEKEQANSNKKDDRAREGKTKKEENAVVRPSLPKKKGIRKRKESGDEVQVSSSGSKCGIRKGRSATDITPAVSKPATNGRSHSTLGHGDDYSKVKANLRPAHHQETPVPPNGTAGLKKGSRARGPVSNRGTAISPMNALASIPTSPVSGKLDPPLPFAPLKPKKKDSSPPPTTPLPSSLFNNQRLPSTIVANQKMSPVVTVTKGAQKKKAPLALPIAVSASKTTQASSTAAVSVPTSKAPEASTTPVSRQPPVLPPPSPSVGVKNKSLPLPASPSAGVRNKSLPLPPPVLPPPPSQPRPLPPSNNVAPAKLRSTPPPAPPAPGFGNRLIPSLLTKGRSPPPPPPPPMPQNGNGHRSGIRPKSTPLTPPPPPPIPGNGTGNRPNSTGLPAWPPQPPPVVPNNNTSTRPKSTPLPPVSANKSAASPPTKLQPAKRRVLPVVETPTFTMPTPVERATMTGGNSNRRNGKKISTDPTHEDNIMSLPIIQIFNAEDENENDVTSVWENRRNAEPLQTGKAKKKSSGSSNFSGKSGAAKDKSSFESLLDKFNNSFYRRRVTDLNTHRR